MLLLLAVGGTACAQAHQDTSLGGRPDGGGIVVHDSNGGGDDAAPIDSPSHPIDSPSSGGMQTLSQTSDSTVASLNSIACGNTSTAQNSYYRVFPLSDYNINGAFTVTNVTFKVEYADSAPPATVIVGTYSGTPSTTLTKANITAIQTQPNVTIPAADADNAAMPGMVDVPISATIPAASNLVVEIDSPDSSGSFYIGTSAGAESKPGYISTTNADCALPTPTSMAQVAGHAASILITVTGTY
jgi:hypothetical protein